MIGFGCCKDVTPKSRPACKIIHFDIKLQKCGQKCIKKNMSKLVEIMQRYQTLIVNSTDYIRFYHSIRIQQILNIISKPTK